MFWSTAMTLFRRALAAIFMAGAIATPVALAATADIQLLHAYAGSWNGSASCPSTCAPAWTRTHSSA